MNSNLSNRSNKLGTKYIATAAVAFTLTFAATGCKTSHSADVVASVNGKAIMRTELDNFYKNQSQQNPQQNVSPDQANAEKLSILRQLIDSQILEQRAAKMNLTASNEEVDAKLNEMKAPYTEEQFTQKLKDGNHTLDDLKREIRRALTTDKLLNKEINSKINITDTEVAGYYNQHKSDYNLIEPVYHLSQVLVTTAPTQQAANLQGSKAGNEAEAKKKVLALKNRLDSGEDFGAIAMNFSEDPQTAQNGGDMGFIPESQLRTNPIISTAVLKLKDGQMSDILPIANAPGTPNANRGIVGYAIIKLISREPAGQRSLQDPSVQQTIRQQLRDARSNLLKSAYFEMLRNQAKVENYFAEDIFQNASK